MTTIELPLTIPEALENWEPACDLHNWTTYGKRGGNYFRPPACGRSATLEVVLHRRCAVTVSCRQCFIDFSAAVCRRDLSGKIVCSVCNASSDNLADMLRAIPL